MPRHSRSHRLLLWAAATDATFERRGDRLVGQCIHCQRRLSVDLDPAPQVATVEHIEPRTHGGTDAVENLAVACARCNQGKGKRLDHRKRSDPTLSRVIDTLRARRAERLRTAPEDWPLPPLPRS
ncbi:MAG: HNH endonuclease [Myxococcota bacterium]